MAKVFSLLCFLGVLAGGLSGGEPGQVLPSALLAFLGLVGLWFPSELGATFGPQGRGWIRSKRPTLVVQRIATALMGAALLVTGSAFL